MGPANMIISRTDSIGDIVLAMPVAAALKKRFPGIIIALLGKNYTREIALACSHIDEFINVDDFLNSEVLINNKKPEGIIHLVTQKHIAIRAAKLKIPLRIGTASRLYHWWTCNKLVALSRKNSGLHEAQLNLKLLKPLAITQDYSLKEIESLYGMTRIQPLKADFDALLSGNKYNIIIHPKSQGNAREWPLSHFVSLINLLETDYYNVFISGVEKELPFIEQLLLNIKRPVTVLAGKIELSQFISFINKADAVVANSTGPLHIAAALGKAAIGIYPPLQPKDPGRWGPVGSNAHIFVLDKNCNDCRKTPEQCACINAIDPLTVKALTDKLRMKLKGANC